MTDLEITRLCAEAIGITGWLTDDDPMVTDSSGDFIEPYDPLHDDAQAMALVKKFGLGISPHGEPENYIWLACFQFNRTSNYVGHHTENIDLNRAICECVAKAQAAKGEK